MCFQFLEPSQPIALEGLDTYQTSANKSFKCESEEILKNKDGKGVQLKIAHVQIEAFRTTSDTKFGPGMYSSFPDYTSKFFNLN